MTKLEQLRAEIAALRKDVKRLEQENANMEWALREHAIVYFWPCGNSIEMRAIGDTYRASGSTLQQAIENFQTTKRTFTKMRRLEEEIKTFRAPRKLPERKECD